MTQRFLLMQQWLLQLPYFADYELSTPQPASNDASFRQYFRVWAKAHQDHQDNLNPAKEQSYIIMDAPPEHEDCQPFIDVSAQLHQLGLQVPQVLAQSLQQGFLLLTDLGSTTYLSQLQNTTNQGVENTADTLYNDALSALVRLQSQGKKLAKTRPPYNATLLYNEMSLFPDWLLHHHLKQGFSRSQQSAWQETMQTLSQAALQQPQTYVHRDYHSRNLMVTKHQNPGILDFQDAVHGPLTYDAVSLLRDCYIAWPKEQVREWQRAYFLQMCRDYGLAKNEWSEFKKSMDLMGVQRHLKAAGIFARLHYRDNKSAYLADIPLTLNYIFTVGQDYASLAFLTRWIEENALPKLAKEGDLIHD